MTEFATPRDETLNRAGSKAASLSNLENNSQPYAFRNATVLCCLFVLVGYSDVVESQQAGSIIEVNTQEDIPKEPFKSWSVFLVCNPKWIMPESDNRISELHSAFVAFGRAIGPDNVATWFSQKGSDRLDFDRSAQFCARLKLPPSQSPYVLLMTHYPGASVTGKPETFPLTLGPHVLLSLNGADLDATMHLLGNLADQIVVSDLSRLPIGSDGYWRTLKDSYTAVRDQFVGIFKDISVTVEGGPVKAEVKF
jgi:hypothetical protein